MNWIFLGAVGGALAVVAGAFGAHALAARLEPRELQLWETAARYLMYGSFALVLAGLGRLQGLRRRHRRRRVVPAAGEPDLQRHRFRVSPWAARAGSARSRRSAARC